MPIPVNRNWVARSWRGLVAIAMVSILVRAPQVLAFPFTAHLGATTVYSVDPITPAFASELLRADRLVAASPLADTPIVREILLTGGGWRWAILAAGQWDAFALTRPFGSAIIVNRTDIAANRVVNGRTTGGVRTLGGVIAHETMHLAIARALGVVGDLRLPRWLREGYPDYIAQESSLSDDDARRLRAERPDDDALFYYDARRRTSAALARNGNSVERLFAAAG